MHIYHCDLRKSFLYLCSNKDILQCFDYNVRNGDRGWKSVVAAMKYKNQKFYQHCHWKCSHSCIFIISNNIDRDVLMFHIFCHQWLTMEIWNCILCSTVEQILQLHTHFSNMKSRQKWRSISVHTYIIIIIYFDMKQYILYLG